MSVPKTIGEISFDETALEQLEYLLEQDELTDPTKIIVFALDLFYKTYKNQQKGGQTIVLAHHTNPEKVQWAYHEDIKEDDELLILAKQGGENYKLQIITSLTEK